MSKIGPGDERVLAADSTWPRLRRKRDLHRHWQWAQILVDKPERFGAFDGDDALVAVWCSAKHRLIELDGHRYYRLDYFEIAPRLAGGSFGPLAAGFIAARAIELGAAGILLAALASPELVAWYKKLGATDTVPKGWTVERGLIPLMIPRSAADRLKENLDDLAEDPT